MKWALVAVFLGAFAAESKPYRISTKLQGETLLVEVDTDEPARINSQAPVSLTLKTNAITFPKTDFSRSDATASEHKLHFEMKGTRDGRITPNIEGHLSFFLCTSKSCKKIEEAFTVQLVS